MAKEVIINTSRVNSYGSRVITDGIDTVQFEKNPILLYMHRRGWDGERFPVGKIENLRKDGDKLIGAPVFDMEDEFAVKVARKWENDFLNMCSAGLEPVEFSTDSELVVPGQTRATVTKSKLVEVSIVDIGANDDCIKLYNTDGKLLRLSSGEPSDIVPLLQTESTPEQQAGDNNNQIELSMNNILLTLGLAATATEQEAVAAITKLQAEAKKAETIELARIESVVDGAIKDKRTTADKRDHFITLGKSAGYDVLATTLDMLVPTQKPTDIITHAAGGSGAQTPKDAKFSDIPEEKLEEMRSNEPQEYIKLFKAEFGFVPELK